MLEFLTVVTLLEFCPKCGTRLVLTENPAGNEAPAFLSCPKCSYKREVVTGESVLLKVIEHPAVEQIAVIDDESAKIRTMPTIKIECPKCGNREAFWWMVQTRGADESPTQFFRCSKCQYTWREMA